MVWSDIVLTSLNHMFGGELVIVSYRSVGSGYSIETAQSSFRTGTGHFQIDLNLDQATNQWTFLVTNLDTNRTSAGDCTPM